MTKALLGTIFATFGFLSENIYALEPVLTADDVKKAVVLDNQKLYKSNDNLTEVHGSCGTFGVIYVEGIEATHASVGLSVSSIQLQGKKNYKLGIQIDDKLQLGDSFRQIVCAKSKDKIFLVVESYLGMGAANEPEPTNYVFDASNGNLITDNCNQKCLEKYLKKR